VKWTYLSFHVKFKDTTNNATTRRVVVLERKIKMTIYIALKKIDDNPNIALRMTLNMHINVQGNQ
jgi:hypothetical protein